MIGTPAFWQRLTPVSAVLIPFSAFYLAGAWLHRNFTWPKRLPVPVISVGNITAGGAGKTPTARALATLLQAMGETPHILTRGYGGTIAGPHLVREGDDWRGVGDEALLLAETAPCWVGSKRAETGKRAAEQGASVVILDDGLQHHRIYKDISLLVLDGAYGVGNNLPLPAGPLRESLDAALARTHAAILIGEDKHTLAPLLAPLFRAKLLPVGDVSWLHDGQWLAFAGLARPQKFFDTLTEQGASLAGTWPFPDHHPYTAKDAEDLRVRARTLGARLVTTEKDWVKLPPELREEVAVLKVAVQFNDSTALGEWLKARLAVVRA